MLGQREPAKLGPPARRNTSLSLMADPYTPASTASFPPDSPYWLLATRGKSARRRCAFANRPRGLLSPRDAVPVGRQAPAVGAPDVGH